MKALSTLPALEAGGTRPLSRALAKGDVDFVMVGHLYHADYSDAGAQVPASLSPQWITGVLRDQLNFDGVVISDDLEMGAIRQHFDLKQTVTMAVRAGMDVLLFSNTAKYRPGLADEIRAILVAEAEADPAFAARIEQSYQQNRRAQSPHPLTRTAAKTRIHGAFPNQNGLSVSSGAIPR
ncbi:hypothetical protein N8D56_13725 [Devosia sp. A8/3-2]|nr:hypothetical protein N8D56_13725 [Devosia sp. A8/3-2]